MASWADIVRFGKAKVQVAVPTKKQVNKKTIKKKAVPKPQVNLIKPTIQTMYYLKIMSKNLKYLSSRPRSKDLWTMSALDMRLHLRQLLWEELIG